VKVLQPDALFTSDITRARQTAEHIGKAIGKEPVFEPLFRELERPETVVGKHFFDPRSIFVFLQMYIHANDLHWHMGNEENFADFRERTHRAVEFLENTNAERIVVVSHRYFIKGMLTTLRSRFTGSMWKFVRESVLHAPLSNGGITELIYDSENKLSPWTIVRINDTRHLAEL